MQFFLYIEIDIYTERYPADACTLKIRRGMEERAGVILSVVGLSSSTVALPAFGFVNGVIKHLFSFSLFLASFTHFRIGEEPSPLL